MQRKQSKEAMCGQNGLKMDHCGSSWMMKLGCGLLGVIVLVVGGQRDLDGRLPLILNVWSGLICLTSFTVLLGLFLDPPDEASWLSSVWC